MNSLSGSPSVTPGIRNALEDGENEIFLSPISVWEALLLGERGRIRFQPDAETWVRMALERYPIIEAPLNQEIAILSRTLDLPHPDPADRFLVATAQVYRARLVTADKRLVKSKRVETYP